MLFTSEQKKYVSGLIIGALSLLIIFLFALSLNAFKNFKYIGTGGDVLNTLTFSGEAEIRIEPDVSKVNFTVEKEDADVSVAQDDVSERIANILDSLDDMGVREKDIRTTGYTTNPRYDWDDGKQTLRGYLVRQSIEITIRDIDDTEDIIGMLGQSDVSSLSGPRFEVEDEERYKEAAREKAIKAAKEKAESLADDLEVRLVRIVSYSEGGSGDYPEPYPRYETAALSVSDGADVEIPTGENIIKVNVSITYEIQ